MYRRMSSTEGARIGRFDFSKVPWFKWFLARWHDADVVKGVCRKSAQIGWTQSVVCNVLGEAIDISHPTCIVLLPSGPAVKKFNEEKFTPLIEANPRLARICPIRKRDKDQKIEWKKLPGGFIKLVGSNTPANVKSTTAQLLIVEEPDDCNVSLKGQGDAIKLLEERGKTIPNLKMLIGGTPTIHGDSSIDDEFELSDQNQWWVPCPDCGEHQTLEWEQVRWLKSETPHPTWGKHQPDTAHYVCAHCGSLWDDEKKNAAVMQGEPRAARPFEGVLGLHINELYSVLDGSRLAVLARKYIAAWREFERGDPEALIPFWNATLGKSWEHKTDVPATEVLSERCSPYASLTVPDGGLVLTAGVDVQHNRFAVVIRAWGRGMESWLVWWGEIHGNVLDRTDAVWGELAALLFDRGFHTAHGDLKIERSTIDSSDGATAEHVYDFVRRNRDRGIMAGKGVDGKREIFAIPSPKDPNYQNTRASKYGLRVFNIGVDRAKELIEGRLKLEGHGAGRIHWPSDIRPDYFAQLLGEVKVKKRVRGKVREMWQERRGQAIEARDCEVYALHAAYSMRLHLKSESYWATLEESLIQRERRARAAPAPKAIATPRVNGSPAPAPSPLEAPDWF